MGLNTADEAVCLITFKPITLGLKILKMHLFLSNVSGAADAPVWYNFDNKSGVRVISALNPPDNAPI